MFEGRTDQELETFLKSCQLVVETASENLEETKRMIICVEMELQIRSGKLKDLLC